MRYWCERVSEFVRRNYVCTPELSSANQPEKSKGQRALAHAHWPVSISPFRQTKSAAYRLPCFQHDFVTSPNVCVWLGWAWVDPITYTRCCDPNPQSR